jgi:RNA polymerase sigma-70 factor (ECF subfamily)
LLDAAKTARRKGEGAKAEAMAEEPSDEALMGTCGGGEAGPARAAFAALAGRWEGRIYAYLVKATRQPEEAHDLRQEVFLRVWRFRASYRRDAAFSHWLLRIAANALRDWMRRRRGRTESSIQELGEQGWTEPGDPSPGPDALAAAGERRRALEGALAALPAEDRQLLLLRFYEGVNYREMSEILELPETTIKSRVYRLLRRLRDELSTRCDFKEEARR